MARKPTVPAPKPQDESPPPEQPGNGHLKESIEREIGPLVAPGQRDLIVARMQKIMIRESFSGPIAHPRHLREYENIEPGAANRIITMAERAQDHNIDMDRKVVAAEVADRKLGMWLGFAALALLAGCAAVFGYLGKDVMAGMFLSAAALGAIGIFVNGRLQNKE